MTEQRSPYDPAFWFRQFPADRWLFRWRFEFFDGKPPRIGGWYPANRLEDMASSVNKTNLSRAIVEGKHWTTREVKVFAEVVGEDFINFEHLAVAIMNEGRLIQHTYGMRIQARNAVISCFENGSVRHESRQLGENHLYPEWTRV